MLFFNIVCNTIRPIRHFKACQSVNLNVTRTYVRWVSRKPVKIVNEDELFDSDDTTKQSILQEKVVKRPRRIEKPVKIVNEDELFHCDDTTKPSISQEKVVKRPRRIEKPVETQEPKNAVIKKTFTKIKENEKIVMSLMTKLRSRKKREKCEEIILEGHRLIKDALRAGLEPTTILFNNPDDIKPFNFSNNVTLYKIPYKTIQLWSSLTTSPGLIGIFKTPDISNNNVAKNALPLTIICDNVRDPGNMGAIMRIAAGVGCEKLIVTKGCVDLWDPKVLRSAAGTHFRLPIYSFPTWDEIPSLISKDCQIFVADSNFGDEFMSHYSPDVLQSSLGIFDIDPESLKEKIVIKDDNPKLTVPKNKNMMREWLLRMPIVPYYSLDYTKKESVIIVSGETEGLSFDSFRFIKDQKSIRINVPLVQEVDSLNVGAALGVVTFEIKRQFLRKQSTL